MIPSKYIKTKHGRVHIPKDYYQDMQLDNINYLHCAYDPEKKILTISLPQ